MRREVPGIALRTTLLTGYPGESEQDFEELLQFVRNIRFERLGVFPYSEEEGTYSATKLQDDVPEEVKQQRVDRIMELQNGISRENNLRRVGRTERVILDRREGDYWIGRTQYDSPEVDTEILISASETGKSVRENTGGRTLSAGQFLDVRITRADDYDLYGIPKP